MASIAQPMAEGNAVLIVILKYLRQLFLFNANNAN